MRRAIFLGIVVIILLAIAFVIGYGWHAYIPAKIDQIINNSPDAESPAGVVPQKAVSSAELITDQENIEVKIGQTGGFKRQGYSEITVELTNLDSVKGYAELRVTLYYAREPVAVQEVIVPDLGPGVMKKETIRIDTQEQWNAFEVEQV